MEINNVYVGNNIEVLKTFPDNSIDSVVTDPPYGLGKEPNAIEVLQSWTTTGYHEVKGKGFMGKEWDAFVPQPNFWKEIYRVLKPGGYVLSFAGTRTYDWMVMAIRLAGFEIRDMIAWLYGSGFPKSHNISKALDKKGSDNAKQWQGWGTALKPAIEPIVMARKPLDGTVAQNVLKHGVGGINIDASRVPLENDETIATNVGFLDNLQSDGWGTKKCITEKKSQGRFPANVIHDGSPEVLQEFPQTTSGKGSFKSSDYQEGEGVTNFTRGDYEGYGDSGSASRFFYKAKASKKGKPYNYSGVTYNNKNTSMFNGDKPQAPSNYNDSGSASRFFYTAKASKKERNLGLGNFPKKQKVFNGQSDTSSNDMKDVEKRFTTQPTQNIHPTVKPIDLMRYLVRLVTPPNGICLDPYLGSGTTAIACELEKFSWIGIELMPEYAEIAKARISAVKDYEATL